MEISPRIKLAVLVAALGYFVDVYDLVLFSIVRVASLKDLGLSGAELLDDGVLLLNAQMIGMLVGGVLWGVWGDKRGRLQVLFGSIILYSLSNLANAFVTSIPQYVVLRFLAGVGLSGEIGAGITLVSELLPKEKRGIGTTIVATIGVSGALAAAIIGEYFPWRTAYLIGGIMGLLLLFLRVSVSESGLFESITAKSEVARGSLSQLLFNRERFLKLCFIILSGVPIWFTVGIIVTFCPELGAALGIEEPLKVSRGIFWVYLGFTVGDLISGLVSQLLKSRKKATLIFLIGSFLTSLIILNLNTRSAFHFYMLLVPLGFFGGYWAVFVTTAAEQFGTNLRATVATIAPNFVRGTVVPMTIGFTALKSSYGVLESAQIVAIIVSCLALLSLSQLKETFGRELDFVEK